MTDTPTTTAGDLIRQLREKAGMSHEELAQKAGLKAATVKRVEERGNRTTFYTFFELMEALGYRFKIGFSPVDKEQP